MLTYLLTYLSAIIFFFFVVPVLFETGPRYVAEVSLTLEIFLSQLPKTW